MSEFAIELKITAQDAGAVQALKAVEEALNKVNNAVDEGGKAHSRARPAAEEHYGTHIKGIRSIHLLAAGILGELSPALNELIFRLQHATVGVRLLSEHLGTGAVLGIGAAVAALTLWIKSVKDAAEWTAKLGTATNALDFGGLKSGLAGVSDEVHTNVELMKTFTGRTSFVISELANMALGAKTAGEKYFDLREAIEQVVPWIEKLDKAQALVGQRQTQFAQAQMGPKLESAIRMTTPQLETERFRMEFEAFQNLVAAQRDKIKRDAQTELAAAGAAGQPQAVRDEILLRMKENLELLETQSTLQLRQLRESSTKAMDAVFYGMIDSAQKARMPMTQAVLGVLRSMSDLIYAQNRAQLATQAIGLQQPGELGWVQNLQARIAQARAAGMDVPLPTVNDMGLVFSGESPFIQRAGALEKRLEELRARIPRAFLRGGRPAELEMTEQTRIEAQGIDLGVQITDAMLKGIQEGLKRGHEISSAQFITSAMVPGFKKTVQQIEDALITQLEEAGFSQDFIGNTVSKLARSRAQEQKLAIGEEALTSGLFQDLIDEAVAMLERSGEGSGDKMKAVVGSRLIAMLTKEISRAGLTADIVTPAVLKAMAQTRQARTQEAIIEEAGMAQMAGASADRIIAAFKQSLSAGFRQKIEEGIRQQIIEAGLAGVIPDELIKAMAERKGSTARAQLLGEAQTSALQTSLIIGIEAFAEEGMLRFAEAQQRVLDLVKAAEAEGQKVGEEELTAWWRGVWQGQEDAIKSRGTKGPRSLRQTIQIAYDAMVAELENLDMPVVPERVMQIATNKTMESQFTKWEDYLLTDIRTRISDAQLAAYRAGSLSMADFEKQAGELEIQVERSGLGDLIPKSVIRGIVSNRRVMSNLPVLEEAELVMLRKRVTDAIKAVFERGGTLAEAEFEQQAGELEEQVRRAGLQYDIPRSIVRAMIGARRGSSDVSLLEESWVAELQGSINLAIKRMLQSGNLAGADVERRAGDIQVQGKKLGMTILHEIALGVGEAEQSGDRMGLAVRIENAVRDSAIRVADGAADIGRTAGERLAAGFVSGILTMERDLGTEGQNLANMTKAIGASMQRGMSDTFFNVLTGQFKNLGDIAKQAGQSVIRSFTDAISNVAVRGIADQIKQWLPQDWLKFAGIGGGAAAGSLMLPGGNAAASVGGVAISAGIPHGNEGAAGGLSLIFGTNMGQLMTTLTGAAGVAFGGLGLYSAATGQAGGPLASGISGALSGLSMGIGLNMILGLTSMTIPVIGLAIGAIVGIVGALFGNQDEKRIQRKQQGYNSWVARIQAAQTFEDLDYILGPGTAPENVAIFQGWFLGQPGPPRSAREKGFDPEVDLRWNTVVYENLDAVPNLIKTGAAVVRQKIAQLAAEEGAPGGLVVEDVLGDIRRVAVFGGGVGSLVDRFAEARARSATAEIFLDTLQDDALAEKLLRRLLDAADKIDLKITRIKPFQVPGAFA